MEAGVELKEYWAPARGADAELESMRVQYAKVQPVPLLPASVIEQALDIVIKMYPSSYSPLSKVACDAHLMHIVGSINRNASPGYPYGTVFPTNEDLMDNPIAYRAVLDLAIWRAKTLSKIDPVWLEDQLKTDPSWAVRHNLCDPMRDFIKDEAHKATKAAEHRWRLINSLSITDQIVERLLFTIQDEREIQVHDYIPSKSGMGLGTTEQITALLDYAQAHGINFWTDVEAWDCFAPEQLLRAEMERRIRLNSAQDSSWNQTVRNVAVLHAHRLLMLTDGRIFKRSVIGGQASGRKITSSANGGMRLLIDVIAGIHFKYPARSMTQGDDDGTYLPDNVSIDAFKDFVKETFGVKLTDAVRSSSKAYFCSQTMFYDEAGIARCIPDNPLKQFVNFVNNAAGPDRDQALRSMLLNFRDHPARDAFIKAAEMVMGRA